jgi:hypothetical protein
VWIEWIKPRPRPDPVHIDPFDPFDPFDPIRVFLFPAFDRYRPVR